MTSFLFICHPSGFCSMSLFLPLCPIFTSISVVLYFLVIFLCFFLMFESDVFDEFVTNRWQNGEMVN